MEKKQKVSTKQWHYFSGMLLAIYLFFHLANQLASLVSIEFHDNMMTILRKVYRNPFIETLLLISVITQIISGIMLIFNKTKKNKVEKIQIYTGIYLSYFLIVHVSAVLYGRYIHLDTNFYYAAAGLNYFPATFYFIPYYFLAVSAITLHISAIHYRKTNDKKRAFFIAIIGIMIAVFIILGYTNYFHFRTVPKAYQDFIKTLVG